MVRAVQGVPADGNRGVVEVGSLGSGIGSPEVGVCTRVRFVVRVLVGGSLEAPDGIRDRLLGLLVEVLAEALAEVLEWVLVAYSSSADILEFVGEAALRSGLSSCGAQAEGAGCLGVGCLTAVCFAPEVWWPQIAGTGCRLALVFAGRHLLLRLAPVDKTNTN